MVPIEAIAKIKKRVPRVNSWYTHRRLPIARQIYKQFGSNPTDEEIASFIRALENGCVASRTIFECNKHVYGGGKEYKIFVIEDPKTGALFKFALGYWFNPRRQYDGVRRGEIKGDVEKYRAASLKV